MLTVITARSEISSCAKQLHRRLKNVLDQYGDYTLGYQAGNFESTVYYNQRLWYSGLVTLNRTKRCFWNAYGTKLKRRGSNDIVVEINIPTSGIYKRLGGVFAKDPITNDVFLLHRGKIGGGRTGIGKSALADWYRGEWVEIDEGHGTDKAILITGLTDPALFENLAFFVEEIERFKNATPSVQKARTSSLRNDVDSFSYTPEFAGEKKGKRPSKFVAECNHGRIVDALEAHLRGKERNPKAVIFNNRSIDLGVRIGKRIRAIYEIKTGTDPQSIYTGIGQLMYHGASGKIISKTLVLPMTNADNKPWIASLEKLGVFLVEYKMAKDRISFMGTGI